VIVHGRAGPARTLVPYMRGALPRVFASAPASSPGVPLPHFSALFLTVC